jgi:5-methyltetrahydrofolate--homocysteine methyltransferase
MASFIDTLRSGRVLLMDGAMGTELQRAGIGENECYEAWNLKRPDAISAIHWAYRAAGAECLVTNTFQLIRADRQGRALIVEAGEKLAEAALALARSTCLDEGFVLATLGPSLECDSFECLVNKKPLVSLIRRLGQADALLLETCSTAQVINAVLFTKDVIAYETSLESHPLILLSVSYRRDRDGLITSVAGDTPERFASFQSIHALGVNCGRDIGMSEIIEIIRRYRQVTDMPLFARPNAGTPNRVGDCWVYPLTPEKMAERLPELLEAGVNMVGGCCGTTPEHIAAMRPIVDAWNTQRGFPPAPA